MPGRTYATGVSDLSTPGEREGREVRITLRKFRNLSRLPSPACDQAVHQLVSEGENKTRHSSGGLVSGCGRAPEAVMSAARAESRPCAWSLGQPWAMPLAFAVAGRGCATRALRRGDHPVAVPRLPLTAGGGWRRIQPG